MPPHDTIQARTRFDDSTMRKSAAALSLLLEDGKKERDDIKGTNIDNLTTLEETEGNSSPTGALSLSSHQLNKYQETHAFLSSGARYVDPPSPTRESALNTNAKSDTNRGRGTDLVLYRDEHMKQQEKEASLSSLPACIDPSRATAANLVLSDDDDLVKEREKEASIRSFSSLPHYRRKDSTSSNKSRTKESSIQSINNGSIRGLEQDTMSESKKTIDNMGIPQIGISDKHQVPLAPMEEKGMKKYGYERGEKDDFDLMKLVAERSASCAFEGGSLEFSQVHSGESKEDETTFHDSQGRLDDDHYYCSPKEDEEDRRRRNIKMKSQHQLPSMPGAYAGAPGAMPRRVRSIRFDDVGNQLEDDAAYADYLDRETQKLAHVGSHDSKDIDVALRKSGHSVQGKSDNTKAEQPLGAGGHREKGDGIDSSKKMSLEQTTRPASTMGLVEARAVGDEESQQMVAGEADVYEGPSEEEKERMREEQKQKYFATICSLSLMLMILFSILWGAGVFKKKPDTVVYLTEAPSNAPSGTPTSAPTPFAIALPAFSTKAIEENPNSPQAKAYGWLQEDPNLLEYSDAKNQQRFALAAFYHGANGAGWTLNNGWLSYDVDECLWVSKWINTGKGGGVCDENGNYLSLVLTLNELSGSLVPEVALLPHLRTIDVASNRLSGSLATELGLLTQLRELAVDVNELTGPLPSELGLINDLEILLLHTNGLTSPIPTALGQLTGLKDFEAGGMQLSGTLPSQLGLMTSLTSLALHSNNLQGRIPPELWDLTNLSYLLQLNSNAFTGTLATEVGLLTKLEVLRLYDTELGGSLPSELGALTALTYMDLCCSYFNQTLPSALGQMTMLNTIFMESNLLSGSIPTQMANAQKLGLLNLHSNKLTGNIPSELSNFNNLDQLFLYNNAFTGAIPSELGLLDDLTTLDIEYNQLSSAIPTELFQMSFIEVLWLGKNLKLVSTIPSEVGLVSNTLTKFAVDWTGVYGFLPTEIGKLSQLKNLNLHQTTMLGPLRSEVGLLTSLEVLNLDRSFFWGTIPTELETLSRLDTFSLIETPLTGTIPPNVCGVPNLHFNCSETLCGCSCPCFS